jgi:preprotein translocase subunit SecA
MFKLFKGLMGGDDTREIKQLLRQVEKVNELEPGFEALASDGLAAKTGEFKERLARGEKLDNLLPEAFALVREGAKRALGQRHFDVQVLGGIVLHQGRIAEMKTGEGKTLALTMPAYLNALTGKGVHVVTVNDYLARFHSQWMGRVYNLLGLEVGLIVHGIEPPERRLSYRADITYGTNNEFGFDYLRDNMVLYEEHLVQRPLHFAIVDEVDSILIDEARTPLIISGAVDQDTSQYYRYAKIVPRLRREEDYNVDEKARTVALTEEGVAKIEKALNVENLYDDVNMEISHHVNQALRAHVLMKKDRDYVVKEGQVIIVDEFTGRLMFGRRYSNGLHQAIEAKEGVAIERESQTLATITLQNYFRMYEKLSGLTGTAKTEEDEFRKIYGMDVVVVPTNRPMIRQALPDAVYSQEKGKFKAVVEEIVERHSTGQPLLVGTISIEKSELLSDLLKKRGIPHDVLNAKQHEREAEIVAQAGRRGAVTIATNMAGRGTDIILEEGVAELGGLHILGTERHEARRIDNQLRGRSGRQGDPGSSQFFISFEDDLMRLFGSERFMGTMEKLGMDDSTPIEHPLLSRAIESAQKRVEGRNFDLRKHVLEYDDVMNKQREVIYRQRREILEGGEIKAQVLKMIDEVIERGVNTWAGKDVYPDDYDLKGLREYMENNVLVPGSIKPTDLEGRVSAEIQEWLEERARELYDLREQAVGSEAMRELERVVVLRTVDRKWMDQLAAMDDLRQGIGLRAFGQKDPLTEYKFEAYDMFNNMTEEIQEEVARLIFRVHLAAAPQRRSVAVANPTPAAGESGPKPAKSGKKVGRNDPCPCGSGKKYKRCCGQQQ